MQSKNQTLVKIYKSYLTVVMLLLFSTFFNSVFANIVDNSKIAKVITPQNENNISGGVTLSLLEHTWGKAEDLLKTDVTSKLQNIKKLGFKTVRLPVAFDFFLQPNSTNFQPIIIDKIGEIYNTCNSLQLKLIISYHGGKIYYGSDNRWYERDRILWMWKQIQNKFRGMGYNQLYFEIYNEPSAERKAWKEDAIYLVNGLRQEDSQRYYIVGGTNYNNADELLDMGKLNDDKVLYTIHFYEPFIFTHQGAEWTKDKTYLTNIPYPYNKKKMPNLAKKAVGTQVEQDYAKYPAEGTKNFMLVRLRRIADECKKNNMTLICTEAGVINMADEKSRCLYLKDITDIFQELNIPLVLWDYDSSFSILQPGGKPIKGIKDWLKKQ